MHSTRSLQIYMSLLYQMPNEILCLLSSRGPRELWGPRGTGFISGGFPHLHPIFNGYGPACLPLSHKVATCPFLACPGQEVAKLPRLRRSVGFSSISGTKTGVKASAGLHGSWRELRANFQPRIMFQKEISFCGRAHG